MPIKYCSASYISKAKTVHGDKFDYSMTEYGRNQFDKISVICRVHGLFTTLPSSHLRGNGGCPRCKSVAVSAAKRDTTRSFINKAQTVHGDTYDYTMVDYVHRGIPVEIICRQHGLFQQLPSSHISQRSGCPKCAGFGLWTQESFIAKCAEVHGFAYSYNRTIYVSTSQKIVYDCAIHGQVYQLAGNHLYGSGCPGCKGYNLTHDEFVRRAKIVHGNSYDYHEKFIRSHDKIEITCQHHGPFSQKAANHLQGQGCPKCGKRISRMENAWLDSLNVPSTCRQVPIRVNGKRYIVDALVGNTVYEFWGDHWHGNPAKYDPSDLNTVTKTSYGSLYDKTQIKKNEILALGYNIVEIWESEWMDRVTKHIL